MKKFLSIILAAILVLSMPLNTQATETDIYTHDELIAMACQAFPEYEAMILGDAASTYNLPRSSNPNEVIYSERRAISETESVGITVFTSGNIIVVGEDRNGYDLEIESGSASNVGSDIIGSASYSVTDTLYSQTFYLSNVGFILHQNGSGYFTNYGTHSGSYHTARRDSAKSTYIDYYLAFGPNGNLDVNFEVYFTNGQVMGDIRY